MAELTTLARPYAKAAFEYALQSQSLDGWSKGLSLLSSVVEQEKVVKLLESPKLTETEKADVLINVCGEDLNDNGKAFLNVLSANGRLLLLPVISELFENLKAQQEKFSDVEVFSAFPLGQELENALSEKLSQALSTEVSINTDIDNSLIGGVVIRAGDTVIDSSLKGRLAKLAENLTH